MSNGKTSNWRPLSFPDISQHKDNPLAEQKRDTQANAIESTHELPTEPLVKHQSAPYTNAPDIHPIDESKEGKNTDDKSADTDDAHIKSEHIYQEQYEKGYEVGHQEGFEQGYQQGQKEGYDQIYQQLEQQINNERMEAAQSILDLVSNFQKSIHDIDETIVPKLADLAMVAAKKLVTSLPDSIHQQLTVTIQELISQFPILGKSVHLYVNPHDIGIMQESLANELAKYDWHLVPDPSIESGGCRVLTDQNEIDATVTSKQEVINNIVNKGND